MVNNLKSDREVVNDGASLNFPLNEIVKKWTRKEFGTMSFSLEAIATVVPDFEDIEAIVGKERLRPAVHAAAAILSAYHSTCIIRDSRTRKGATPIPEFITS